MISNQYKNNECIAQSRSALKVSVGNRAVTIWSIKKSCYIGVLKYNN